MSRWFRHYAGLCRDEKLVSVAIKAKQTVERVVWVYCAILESAAEIDEDGRYSFDTAEVAYFLRADEDHILAIVAALQAYGRLAEGCVVKWSNRQFSSDRSKDRVAAYRERKRAEGVRPDNNVPSQSGGVTLQKCYCNSPETDTEKDKEGNIKAHIVDEPVRAFSGNTSSPVSGNPPSDPAILKARKAVADAYRSVSELPPDTSRVGQWVANGFTADEIESVVTAVLQRGTKPTNLKYFDRILEDLRTAPRAPPHQRQARPGTANDAITKALREIKNAKRTDDNRDEDDFTGVTISARAIR